MHIRFLPSAIINQIAAGEIIMHYVDIIKELVENSIDAAASKIDVSIDFPITTIIVRDNGEGMDFMDLKRAVLRHTTSKLEDNNLNNVNTLGFRGEALSSIASIACMHIQTNRKNDYVSEIEIVAGNIKCARKLDYQHSQSGTTIKIQNIFLNVQARLKFLGTDEDEYKKILYFMKVIALAHTKIDWRLYRNDKLVVNYHSSPQINVHVILGDAWRNQAQYYHVTQNGWSVHGYACKVHFLSNTLDDQYFFINGRHFYDRHLSNFLKKIYNAPQYKHPCVIALFDIPPQWIDVNIHPRKTEIRFRDVNQVSQLFKEAITGAIHNINHSFKQVQLTSQRLNYFPERMTISSWNTYDDASLYDASVSTYTATHNNIQVPYKIKVIDYNEYIICKYNDSLYLLNKQNAYKIFLQCTNKIYCDVSTVLPIAQVIYKYQDLLHQLGIKIRYESHGILLEQVLESYNIDKVKHALCVLHSNEHSHEQIKNILVTCCTIDHHQLVKELINKNMIHHTSVCIDGKVLSTLYNSSNLSIDT